MNATQKIGVTDVARMLDSIRSCRAGSYPETEYVLHRLIEHSPLAKQLHDRLHARPGEEPSLFELARLWIAVDEGESHAPAAYTARWLVQGSPPAAELLAQLEQMARDAGYDDGDPGWLVKALDAHEELDRLLATLDDGTDAGEAIQLEMRKDDAYRILLKVCRARIAHARGDDRKHLERLRRRLQDAARRKIRIRDAAERVRQLESSLRSKLDPAAALETVERLIHQPPAE